MSLLAPLFLLAGLLAVPIVILYMLRLRRTDMVVSSTMLWQRLLRDREANAPWQRLRRNLLLLLQLLILVAMVFALARPYLPVRSVINGNVVVLLDGSASMLATDIEPNRFLVAKEIVSDLIGDVRGNDQMTLILVGREPTVLASATNDSSQLQSALASAEVATTPADWPAAIALASGAAQGFQDARIIVVSDGGLPKELPPLPVEAFYMSVGENGENLAISALATREGEGSTQLFANVANHGLEDQSALLTIKLDDSLFDSKRISVPAGENSNLTWDLPENVEHISAQLSGMESDIFELDDIAWAVNEGVKDNKALMVTEGNRFLETILGVLPGQELVRISPTDVPDGATDEDSEATDANRYDLYVYDSVPLPNPLPASDVLIFNPQNEENEQIVDRDDSIEITGTFSNTNIIRIDDSPLLEFVDWSKVNVRQAQHVNVPWARTLIAAEGGPLLVTGERDGYRLAMLTFSLQESDLPLQIAFPILMANITGWLSPGAAFDSQDTVHPGDPLKITPGSDTTAVSVLKPDNSIWSEEIGIGSPIFAETEQLGIYEVSLLDEDGERSAGDFSVNLFDASESSLQPAGDIQFGRTTTEKMTTDNVGQRELWPWLAAAAVVLLVVEWWAYHRGVRVPQIPARQTILEWISRR